MRASYVTRILTVALVLFVFAAVAQTASAQFLGTAGWDRKTTMTINKTWKVPGATLPPGTYVFRLLNAGQGAGSTRNVLLVFSQDEKQVVAIAMGLTAYRLDTSGPIFHFKEVQPGAPEKLHTWFYPSYGSGIEFVYGGEAVAGGN